MKSLFWLLPNWKKKYNHIKLLLVGPFEPELDPLSPFTKKQIENNKNIIWLDFQEDIRPFLCIGNVLAFPSYREGFPNVPMQAGCFEMPSIVTDINGCNEIVENMINGLVVPAKNAEALQNAMEKLLSDKELFDLLKINARQMITDRYNQKHIWQILLNEYNYQLSHAHIR